MTGADGLPEAPAGPGTRCRIEHVAAELFHRHGYPGTSVRRILAALGMSPGALYNHFRSKDALLHAIAAQHQEDLEQRVTAALRRGGTDPVRQLWETALAVTECCAEHRARAAVARSERRYLDEGTAARLRESERRMRRDCERVLTAGQARGDFRVELPDGRPADLTVTARALLDLCVTAALRPVPPRGGTHDLGLQCGVLALQAVGVGARDIRSVAVPAWKSATPVR
ncbi:TetR/AcrR family transcriptional regulator [Streptomyces sp. 549]|uniref:TetR/AcrR family transcriptional regulator n=1 Tax=Streptomyces sp. 549 TaxID=3049076 RepID=UPI0024C42125|nr:TetR/AcrR family transcriptional regulator [Streptomyces sp. 549]MDK1475180.1 TetR/AcrR family transcriptional regulator [Streptomyces sp. 549]